MEAEEADAALPNNKVANAWDRVQISRMKDRPVGSDYIEALFTDFIEFHGDRYYADDKAIIGGVARFHGKPVTVIAQAKEPTPRRISSVISECHLRTATARR